MLLHFWRVCGRSRGQTAKWLLLVFVVLSIVFLWTRTRMGTLVNEEEVRRTTTPKFVPMPIHRALHYIVTSLPRQRSPPVPVTVAVFHRSSSSSATTKTTPAASPMWSKNMTATPTKPKTQNQSRDHSSFFEEILNGTNDVHINRERGFWSGSDTARYHRSHFGNGTASKLVDFFTAVGARSVIDLGGGDGEYARRLLAAGIHVSCYDGNPQTQLVSAGTCAVLDLTRPVRVAPHEWALSLSVGRQIPPQHERTFIVNVDSTNTKGIVLYWGDDRPDRTGRKSVRSNVQVVQNFTRLGYRYDAEASERVMGGRKAVEVHRGYSFLVFHKKPQGSADEIRIVAVCCSMAKLRDAMIMLRAAVLFTQHVPRLTAYVFSDEETTPVLKKLLEGLSVEAAEAGLHHFHFELHRTSFPAEVPGTTPWKHVFKTCSLQRLFLPDILPTVDSVLYLDADTIPLANLSTLWSHFSAMNSTQFTTLVPITEAASGASWFTMRGIPHFGPTGLNCGVALMNLTRMRDARFVQRIIALRAETEATRPKDSGDQFLQNVFFSRNPQHVLPLSCEWNLRRMHCHCKQSLGDACACKPALAHGVSLLHGTREAFNEPESSNSSTVVRNTFVSRFAPLFRGVSKIFESHSLREWSGAGGMGWREIAAQLGAVFEKTPADRKCFMKSSTIFFQPLTTYFANLNKPNM